MTSKGIIATILALTISGAAQAEAYIGFSLGQGKLNEADIDFNTGQFGYAGTEHIDLNEKSLAGSLYAGYNFNDYLGIEVSIGGMDAIDETYASIGEMMYFAVQPKLSLPLTPNFSVYGKAGLAHFSAETILNGNDLGLGYVTTSDSVITGIVGLGGEFALSQRLKLRAGWEYIRPELELFQYSGASLNSTLDIQMLTLGLNYQF